MTLVSADDLASVVIPTYNRMSLLTQLIAPLLEDPYTGEVIIVVDGSADGSYEFIQEWSERDPRVVAIFQENSGEAVARRAGIEASRHEVVVILDDDVVPTPGLVSGHCKWHRESENLLVVGYMPVVVPDIRRRGQIPTILYAETYEETCRFYERDPRTIFTHMWAGNLSLRRTHAIKIGSRDERRLNYHADLKFGLQCEEIGLHPIFDRSLLANHWHSRNLRGYATDCRRSGRGRAQINHEYPDLADKDSAYISNTLKERLIAQYLAAPFVRHLSAALAMTFSYLSGWIGAWNIQKRSTRLLKLIESASGYKTYDHID